MNSLISFISLLKLCHNYGFEKIESTTKIKTLTDKVISNIVLYDELRLPRSFILFYFCTNVPISQSFFLVNNSNIEVTKNHEVEYTDNWRES